jgi:hypothetical protein
MPVIAQIDLNDRINQLMVSEYSPNNAKNIEEAMPVVLKQYKSQLQEYMQNQDYSELGYLISRAIRNYWWNHAQERAAWEFNQGLGDPSDE